MPRGSQLWIVGIVLTACVCGASGQTFVDSNGAELAKEAPELSALDFSSDQSTLDPLLQATGQQLASMIQKFADVSIAEDVHEMRFDRAPMIWREHRDKFRYVVTTNPFAESRRQSQGGEVVAGDAKSAFPVPQGFVDILSDLLPQNQSQLRFRYLGRIAESGGGSFVVAFLARDGTRQGLVWIDEATKRLLRLRADVLKHPEAQKLETFARDVRYVLVNFPASGTTLWLPSRATVHLRFAAGELHTVHRFSDCQMEGQRKDTGKAAGPVGMGDDGFEVLLKGAAALEAGKPADAVARLQEAEARLPDRVEPFYYLGAALYKMHDLAGAETQLREAIKRSPGLAVAHNELGAVLFKRGDKPASVAELQEAARLDPGNAKIRANLDAATAASASSATGESTIKVNVRQVLVPVVVTDKDGHHLTGLTQADFKVLEDGVEQKITAFTSERSDVPSVSASAESSLPVPVVAGSPKPLAKQHTYVICVDAIHASFANFVYVREALRKLFQREQAGDSQYAVIALGREMDIVQNLTPDPTKVLETIGGANFRKTFLQSQKSSSQFALSHYETDLQEARAACDAAGPTDPACETRKRALPPQANALAEEARVNTAQFLDQFRSLVEQMARGTDRRTLVLISDGFLLTPGQVSYGLLETYFPEFRSTRTIERMEDSIEPIFRLAAKGNLPIYTIDSRGLYTSPGLDVSRGSAVLSVAPQVDRLLNDIATDEGLTLAEISAATGGTAFRNSNDLFAGLKKAFADGREYYTLAYVSTNDLQDGKFRKIEVKVRDKKAKVSAKRGYWASSQ